MKEELDLPPLKWSSLRYVFRMIDRIHLSEMRVAVYLAPRWALVAEIEANLVSLLGAGHSIEVSSLPIR
jgi:hypothetical protein